MRKGKDKNNFWTLGLFILLSMIVSVIFVHFVTASSESNRSIHRVQNRTIMNETINKTGNATINKTGNAKAVNKTGNLSQNLFLSNRSSEMEKVYKFQVISSDLTENTDMVQFALDERGRVIVYLKLNASFYGINRLQKTYYISPENNLSSYLDYSSTILVNGDGISRNYFEMATFNLLNTTFTSGIYDLYRDYGGIPLFVGKINVTGNLPSVFGAKENKREDNTWLGGIVNSVELFWNYLFGKKEIIPVLAVDSVNWLHSGENWEIYANYSDQNSNPILDADCRLNTDKWGLLQMHYVPEKKLYMVEHVADSVGQLKWTVVCEEKK